MVSKLGGSWVHFPNSSIFLPQRSIFLIPQSSFHNINLKHLHFRSRNARREFGNQWNTPEVLTASLQAWEDKILRAGICWGVVLGGTGSQCVSNDWSLSWLSCDEHLHSWHMMSTILSPFRQLCFSHHLNMAVLQFMQIEVSDRVKSFS